MKRVLMPAIVLIAVCGASAKDKPAYQNGLLRQMDSQTCGSTEKSTKTFADEVLGMDGERHNTSEVLCQEYTLQTDRLLFRIRPKKEKHAALLPPGESVHFRLHKNKLLLVAPETNGKEREYIVVSMTPRTDGLNSYNQSTTRLAPLR
ncbi:MAG TPA: hypothetical protein VIM00_14115 [Candidatus Acidoferrum sp.]